MIKAKQLVPLDDRGPLRVMFCITSMPVGGAETLLVNLIRRLDRARFAPELCCLKELGPLGEVISTEIPAFAGLIGNKYDVRVLGRLTKLLRTRHVDALVTVGAGDKMFWGRLAAWRAGVPVVASALHSTGWPDGIGRLNRRLTRITDAFIGVAPSHGQHLVEREAFPADKVYVIPNGVDIERFRPKSGAAHRLREQLGIPTTAPVLGIVAALRPEKNHELLLRAAQDVLAARPDAQTVIVGDGPERGRLEQLAAELGISRSVHFLGTRPDVHEVLSMLDVFVLTSHIEANPVSILEAMATAKPVIATRVGSIPDTVSEGTTGYLVTPGDAFQLANRIISLIDNPDLACRMGQAGRDRVVQHWSLEAMVSGYEELITGIYRRKAGEHPVAAGERASGFGVLEPAHAAN